LHVRKILSGIARGGERWGRRKIAAMLTGQLDDLPPALTALSTTGLLREHDPRIVEKWIDALEGAGAVASSPDMYRTVRLTTLGREVMAGRVETLDLLVPSVTVKRAKSGRKAPKAARDRGDVVAEAEPDGGLVDALKHWRRAEASRRNMPPYVILHDKTIAALAAVRPRSAEALLDVPGLGPAKVAQYGDAILQVLGQSAADAGD